jgi:glycosyltransferase involved in cell wall biosynthesis
MKNPAPAVGVVIPTIGDRPELKRLLLSILDQTRRVETICIVVDSEDTSLVDRIVGELDDALAATTVTVISTGAKRAAGEYLADTGYGFTVNRGLEMLNSEFVAFLDDDDEIRPGHFAQLEAAIDPAEGVGVAYARVDMVLSDGRRHPFPRGDMPSGEISTGVLIDSHPVLLPATLIHRSVLERVASLDETFDRLADTDMVVRLGLATRFAAAEEPTYVYYRVSRKTVIQKRQLHETSRLLAKHEGSLTRSERMRFWDTQARNSLRIDESELARDAAQRVISALWANPPAFLVGWYLALRGRETTAPIKWLARRLEALTSRRSH